MSTSMFNPSSMALSPLGWPSGTNPANVPASGNPSAGTATANNFSPYSTSGNLFQTPPGFSQPLNSPGGGEKSQITNSTYLNNLLGQTRGNIGTQMANAMFGYSAPAGNYFQTLMNLGAPYYQQQQRASFENAAQNYNNAAAQGRNQMQATGLGYGPSGANVATMGGLAQGLGGSLTQNYLQNLFQNEALQMQGAQGLSSLAGQFNPAGVLGPTMPVGNESATQLDSILGSILGMLP